MLITTKTLENFTKRKLRDNDGLKRKRFFDHRFNPKVFTTFLQFVVDITINQSDLIADWFENLFCLKVLAYTHGHIDLLRK